MPLRGSDAFLFAAVALIIAAVCTGKLASVWALCLGGILGTINYYANLLQISNSVAIWLSIQPADIFFYAFIPPLVVEETIRIDLFLLRKAWVHVILLAYVLVGLSIVALTPIILYMLKFNERGWSWVHGAIFSAIISPTDTVAVAAILTAANGPAKLTTIIKGESVFNDASGITFYSIFAKILAAHAFTPGAPTGWPSVWSTLPGILRDIVKFTAIGVGIGLAMSWATGRLLRWMRWRGVRPYVETTIVLAVSYLCYYVTNGPAGASGVIALVMFGLYGNATSKWGMLATAEESGAFDAVWDMVAFGINGLVFFWSGVASVNFLIRSSGLLARTGASFAAIPVIWIAMVVIRTGCIILFNPLFKWMGQPFTPAEIGFSGWASMRGAVSLIMASAFAVGSPNLAGASNTGSSERADELDTAKAINAEILLWTASFVLLTLIVNGSLCGAMLRLLRLGIASKEKLRTRERAKRDLCDFTERKLAALRTTREAEFLTGANWDLVAQYVHISADELNSEDSSISSESPSEDTSTALGVIRALWRGILRGLKRWLTCKCIRFPKVLFPRRFRSTHRAKKREKLQIDDSRSGNSPQPSVPSPIIGANNNELSPPNVAAAPSLQIVVQHPPPTPVATSTHLMRDSQTSGLTSRGSFKFIIPEDADWVNAGVECPFLDPEPPATNEFKTSRRTSLEGQELQPQRKRTSTFEGWKKVGPETRPNEFISGDVELGNMKSIMGATEITAATDGSMEPKSISPSASLPSISEYNPDMDQQCIRGAAGAALLQNLKHTLQAGVSKSDATENRQSMTVPASQGRVMQSELLQQLAQRRNHSDAEASTSSQTTPKYMVGADTVGSSRCGIYTFNEQIQSSSAKLHSATVSGASGLRLATELKRQLAQTSSTLETGSSLGYSESGRDLLGRKASSSSTPKVGNGNSSETIFRRSPYHVVGKDRAVLPASAPLAAALLNQSLSALQRQQRFQNNSALRSQGSLGATNDESGLKKSRSTSSFSHFPAAKKQKERTSFLLRKTFSGAGFVDPPPPASQEMLIEEKSRVVSGLKRHFTARRLAGLISAQALRILEFSCEAVLESNDGSLRLWPVLEGEVRGGWVARGASRLSLATLSAYRKMHPAFRRIFSWPMKRISGFLRRYLGRRMLVACEVAVELYLSLSITPQVQWLKREEHCGIWRSLLNDIEVDTEATHHFIIHREIEAPDLFKAIQSYRAAMAVLRQQLHFTEEMLQMGAIDDADAQRLIDPIDKRIRHLELVGPVWRPPRPKAVLRSLPFMAALPDAAFRRLYAAGSILSFRKGYPIWSNLGESCGLFIVVSGVVKRVLTRESEGLCKEYFQGPGGVIGALLSVANSKLAGVQEVAVAEGNALGRGPIVFHLPQAALQQLIAEPEFKVLGEEFLRLGAAFLMEHLDFLQNEETEVSPHEERVRDMLGGAVLRLSPGQVFFQDEFVKDVVLVTGSLLLGSSFAMHGEGRITAPALLPRGAELMQEWGEEYDIGTIEWLAGEEGATMVAVYSSSEEESNS